MNMNSSTATTSWLNTKLAAYRADRAEREAICYLITLHQQQLRDMGVNLPELIDAAPGLAKYRSEDMEVHHHPKPSGS